jgi:hypothetical protein
MLAFKEKVIFVVLAHCRKRGMAGYKTERGGLLGLEVGRKLHWLVVAKECAALPGCFREAAHS